jgi:hypothetical protein
MKDTAAPSAYDVTCPHCKKQFAGKLLGDAGRHRGFKCPHCRLFVPFAHANGERASP